ncbi:MAG TPA: hypothetical protein VEC14_06255, partial [Reyranellaceae bacterium]|nr:hypothetical protein [Reyranellaceae bacterium]
MVVKAGAVKNRRSMGLEIIATKPLVNGRAGRVVALQAGESAQTLVDLQQLAVGLGEAVAAADLF